MADPQTSRATRARWQAKLQARRTLEARARARHIAHPTPASRATLTLRKAQVAQARRVAARYAVDRVVLFDGCPIYLGLAEMLADCRRHGWRGTLNSGLRTEVAHRYHKKSQADLYALWLAFSRKYGRRGAIARGVFPANPATVGTHVLVGDGVVGAYGAKLAWWQCGMDVEDSDGLLRVGRKLGYDLYRPYDTPSEYHHLNLRRARPAR